MLNYFRRVNDYMTDPCFGNAWLREPWVIFPALWHSLFNAYLYKE